MNTLFEHWHRMCRDEIDEDEDVDKSDFHCLLHSDPVEPDREILTDLMQHFPEKEALVERILVLIKLKWHSDAHRISEEKMVNLAGNHVKEMVRFYAENDFTASLSSMNQWRDFPVSMTTDSEKFNKLLDERKGHHASFIDITTEMFDDYYSSDDFKFYCLKEAIFGLSYDLNLRTYALTPFINVPVNFDHYVELKRAGAQLVIDVDRVLVFDHRRI